MSFLRREALSLQVNTAFPGEEISLPNVNDTQRAICENDLCADHRLRQLAHSSGGVPRRGYRVHPILYAETARPGAST